MAILLTERKPYLLLLILLTFHLGLMSSRIRNASERSLLAEGILSLGSPFLKAAGGMGQGVSGTWNAYVGLRGVEKENRRLREQVDALALQANAAAEARQESERLRALLDLRAALPFQNVAARVIARGVDGGARVVTLDRGTGAGVRINQPVITPRGVVGFVLRRGMGMALRGVGFGLLAALALSRLLGSLLFGVAATDPLTFTIVPGLLILAALLASYLPARRAASIDPAVSLRSE